MGNVRVCRPRPWHFAMIVLKGSFGSKPVRIATSILLPLDSRQRTSAIDDGGSEKGHLQTCHLRFKLASSVLSRRRWPCDTGLSIWTCFGCVADGYNPSASGLKANVPTSESTGKQSCRLRIPALASPRPRSLSRFFGQSPRGEGTGLDCRS